MTSAEEVAQWWGTSVSRMAPGVIELRGRPVQELIGSTSLPAMIWLLHSALSLRGCNHCQSMN